MIITPIMKTLPDIDRIDRPADIPVEMPLVHFPELEKLLKDGDSAHEEADQGLIEVHLPLMPEVHFSSPALAIESGKEPEKKTTGKWFDRIA